MAGELITLWWVC